MNTLTYFSNGKRVSQVHQEGQMPAYYQSLTEAEETELKELAKQEDEYDNLSIVANPNRFRRLPPKNHQAKSKPKPQSG